MGLDFFDSIFLQSFDIKPSYRSSYKEGQASAIQDANEIFCKFNVSELYSTERLVHIWYFINRALDIGLIYFQLAIYSMFSMRKISPFFLLLLFGTFT